MLGRRQIELAARLLDRLNRVAMFVRQPAHGIAKLLAVGKKAVFHIPSIAKRLRLRAHDDVVHQFVDMHFVLAD